jgi:hypothetical protein
MEVVQITLIARALWSSTPKRRRLETLSTPLTQTRKREAKNIAAMEKLELVLNAPNVCGICGTSIPTVCKYCRICATRIRRENVIKASKLGLRDSQTAGAGSPIRNSAATAGSPENLEIGKLTGLVQREILS